ncbi:MAG: MBL fold metallo-hydrolase [Propioniciclava sp.]
MSSAPYAITLGTGGGPVWDRSGDRTGIATALVIGDRTYLIDAGSGVGRQLVRAGRRFDSLRGIFITHLHSDHIVDLGALMIFSIMRMPVTATHRIPIIGPGPRGVLPQVSPRSTRPVAPDFPEDPTPGIGGTVDYLMRAFATDLNDRKLDSLKSTPLDWFHPQEIQIPAEVGFHANDNPTPDVAPFPIFEDEAVRVTATLVKHAPLAPAFGFRFETDGGVLVVSGDTGPTPNLVRLAHQADLLLHEALDFDWVEEQYAADRSEAAEAVRDHHYAAHTSPRDAIRIATEAGARQLALHHLVPRTGAQESWFRDAGAYPGRFSVPADLEVIPLVPRGLESVHMRAGDAGGARR